MPSPLRPRRLQPRLATRERPPLSRLVLPPVVYCVTADEATNAVEAVVRDAMGRPIGLDIETAASPAERTRLKALTLSFAAAKGKLAGLRKAKASAPDIKTAAKQCEDARRAPEDGRTSGARSSPLFDPARAALWRRRQGLCRRHRPYRPGRA